MTKQLLLRVDNSPFEIIRDLGRYARSAIGGCLNSYSVLMMIADRSLGWGNDDEVITEDQFINGVYGRDGTCWHVGTGISRATLYRCLRKLHDTGAIIVRKLKHKGKVLNAYSLNTEWAVSLMGMIKVAKKTGTPPVKLRERAVSHRDISPTSPVSQRDGKEEDPILSTEEEISPPAAGIATAIARAKEVTANRAEKRYQRYKDSKDPGKLFTEHWLPAVAKHWPAAVLAPVTGRERGQLRNFAEAWQAKDGNVGEFLSWVAENWRSIHAAKFRFIRDKVEYPEYPDFGFLMGFKRAFLDSWSRRATLAEDVNLTEEQRLMKQLRFRGFTHEGAEAELAKIMAQRQTGKRHTIEHQRLVELAETIEVRARQINARAELQPVASTVNTVPKIKQVRERPTIAALPQWRDED